MANKIPTPAGSIPKPRELSKSTLAEAYSQITAPPAPDALIFDMDGVLVDVSQSYRSCIVASAAHYGQVVTREDIDRVKRDGNANNDWVLTQLLLERKGVRVALDDIIQTFQKFYNGSENTPGFFERESLLIDPDFLKTIANRFPLAIVTGRPRAEAVLFLSRFGLKSRFSCLVAMEDAPLKPDPTGVAVAIASLGARRAWMIGDTPDDILAAIGAGAIAIGIQPPEDLQMREALIGAGAVAILPDINQLERILP